MIVDFGTDLVDSAVGFFAGGSSSPGASGGFLLYPSKPNRNQAERVYSK
jgi:hypothetical protein